MDAVGLKTILCKIFSHPFLKVIAGSTTQVFHWIFGANTELILILYVLIFFDTITGFLKSCKQKTVSSRGFRRLPIKCIIYFTLLATAYLLSKAIPAIMIGPFSLGDIALGPFVAGGLIITETLSIIENAGEAGYPLPKIFKKILKNMNPLKK